MLLSDQLPAIIKNVNVANFQPAVQCGRHVAVVYAPAVKTCRRRAIIPSRCMAMLCRHAVVQAL